jgi:hypothetical protein
MSQTAPSDRKKWEAPTLHEIGTAVAAEFLLDHGHDGHHTQGKLLAHS